MELSLKKARSIIKKAQETFTDEDGDEYQIYEGDMPDDDKEIISEAENLIEMATDARDNDYENEAVTAILFLAEVDGGTDSDPGTDDDDDPAPDGFPIDDYDDLKVSKIISKLDDLTPAQLGEIYEYESAHKSRPTLIAVLEEMAADLDSGQAGDDPDEGAGAELTWDDLEVMDRADLVKIIEEDNLDIDHKGKRQPTLVDLIAEKLDISPDSTNDDDGSAEDPAAEDPSPDDDPVEDPEPDPEPLDPPWRGYDARKQDEIIKVLDNKDDETLAAAYEYEMANKARKGVIKALEKLAEERGLGAEDPPDPDPDPVEDDPAEQEIRAREEEPPDDAHEELIAHVTKRVEEEHLAVPKRPPEERLEIPFDLTECSDTQIRQLYSASRAYFARAAYVGKLEGQLSAACKQIADKHANAAIVAAGGKNPETGKARTATELKAIAESDDVVEMWRGRERSHGQVAESMKKDADIFEKDLEALSREWTMRHEELEHQGGLKGRGGRK